MTIKDIDTAISKMLSDKTKITIQSTDIREGFTRPSFYVTFPSTKKSPFNEYLYERNLSCKIYYFPKSKDDYSLELMEMQEKLENMFYLKLNVLDRKLNITEVDSYSSDGELQFDFDLNYFETPEDSISTEKEFMRELDIRYKK